LCTARAAELAARADRLCRRGAPGSARGPGTRRTAPMRARLRACTTARAACRRCARASAARRAPASRAAAARTASAEATPSPATPAVAAAGTARTAPPRSAPPTTPSAWRRLWSACRQWRACPSTTRCLACCVLPLSNCFAASSRGSPSKLLCWYPVASDSQARCGFHQGRGRCRKSGVLSCPVRCCARR